MHLLSPLINITADVLMLAKKLTAGATVILNARFLFVL